MNRVRALFRGFRIVLLLLVLAILLAWVYQDRAGLPDFIKRPLLAQFESKGWEVECGTARWRLGRGIVLEDVSITEFKRKSGLYVFMDQAQCQVDRRALAGLEFRVRTLQVNGGRLAWTLGETNQPEQTFQLHNLQGEMEFLPGNLWVLRSLEARCFGAHFSFAGTLTNALAIRSWKLPSRARAVPSETPPVPGAARERWRRLFNLAGQFRFSDVPRITCQFAGDGSSIHSFRSSFAVAASDLHSPWVSGTNLVMDLQVYPDRHSAEALQAELHLTLENAVSPWGKAGGFKLFLHGEPSLDRMLPSQVTAGLELSDAETPWGRSRASVLTARSSVLPGEEGRRSTDFQLHHENLISSWGNCLEADVSGLASHSVSNLYPVTGSAQVRLRRAHTRWAEVGWAGLGMTGTVARLPRIAETNLTWPERLQDFAVAVSGSVSNVRSAKLDIDWGDVEVSWQQPGMSLSVKGSLGGGPVDARATLNTETREVHYAGAAAFDPRTVTRLLTTNAVRWLERYTWEEAPRVEAEGRLVLPEWRLGVADWSRDVRPTVAVAGSFELGHGTYRGVPFTSARSPFEFSNLVWRLTDLYLTRPEGVMRGVYTSHAEERNFHWRVQCQIDPGVAGPFLDKEKARRALGFFQFAVPPKLDAEVWGNWLEPERIGFTALVEITNGVFRGEPVEYAQGRLAYTNKLLSIYDPQVRRTPGESARAEGVLVDVEAQKIYITNAVGRMMPLPVARVISSQALKAIEPFQFDQPPEITVSGVVDAKRKRQEYDLHFDVSGGPFHWKMFHLGRVEGKVHWLGQTLALNNMTGQLHGGRVDGHAWFDFEPDPGAQFRFYSRLTNVNFRTFTEDISGNSNRLEGWLSGELTVTNAQLEDWKSWQGYGRARLQDGLIWDIPMFGVFSPVLNLVADGLGNSRARDARSDFVITNSIIHTSNLEVQATLMRMVFSGTSDFDRQVNGRMEAELFRDLPAIGPLLSKVLWPVTKVFEYQLTGTVNEPRIEPVFFISKILLFPLNPLKSLRDLFLPGSGKSAAGNPPVTGEP